MDDLLQKYNDFMRLNNCRAEYLLSNGQTIDFVYKEENFIHLLGLHKLIDIQLIQLFNDKTNKMVQTKYIISRIKKGKLTDAMVRASVFYNDISERYENFSYDNLTTLNYTDAVINFNPSLINSKIKSDYLLFETSVYKGYKQDKIEMRGDRAEMSDFPLYLNTVAGGLDRRDQTIGGFSFVVKIYAVPVVEIIG